MKRNHPFTFSLWLINNGGAALSQVNIPHCHVGKKRYFSHSPISITLCNGASIYEYKAYWHMNPSLINGCGTHENNIHGHSFWNGTCEFTNIIIVNKKSKQTSIRKKIAINSDHSNKSRETRAASTLADILVDPYNPAIIDWTRD